MKDKQLKKKLVLNKETIAHFEIPRAEMGKVNGGEWEYTINYPISCRTRNNCQTQFPVCQTAL